MVAQALDSAPAGRRDWGLGQPGAYVASPGLGVAAPGYTIRPLRGEATRPAEARLDCEEPDLKRRLAEVETGELSPGLDATL